ncbi:MAG TPA: lipase maturation factor family protein [Acidisarcina sp.]
MLSDATLRLRNVFDRAHGVRNHLIARWLFLRALGLIYFSAFFALVFQIRGLIGPAGILPAADYLGRVARGLGPLRLWYAPTLLWFSAGPHMLMGLCWVGVIGSLLLVANVWPRAMLIVCFVCFLSFVSAAQDFSGYQSDGMLLEAGFLSLFLAPGGLRPGWGERGLASLTAYLLLLWEWFRIYFESGVVKLMSGDPTWRNFTAMYEYYQNGPLPTWIGWYLQHLPNWFHIATAVLTLAMELVLVWLALLPGRWRVACFFIVTAWQAGVILTANYAFLNYLVLALAFLLLEDRYLTRFVPARCRPSAGVRAQIPAETGASPEGVDAAEDDGAPARSAADSRYLQPSSLPPYLESLKTTLRVSVTAIVLTWIFYATAVPLVRMFWRGAPLPDQPIVALEPFRVANQYGLFAVMTPHRYEIEFQGSMDGVTWTAYPFRYKPQDIAERPRIYAPYQPRFDWNLWFASLGSWSDNPIVPRTEEALLANNADVLGLFRSNPFASSAPRYVRAVLWQYWFSTPEEKRSQGLWWRRELLGTYAPTIERSADGHPEIVAQPTLGREP